MIKIEKIEFFNYRQYRNVSISFSDKHNYQLHILRAKNGTGKTTFLNGILWCLYAKEYYINDESKALKVINETVVQDANVNDIIEVKVRLTISDEDKYVIFERGQKFNIFEDPLTSLKQTIEIGKPVLKVIENPKFTYENSKVYETDDETQRIVKQYFDEDIYSYYFFDGENLRNYFDKKNASKVKDSIYSLSQVNLLSNASRRTEVLSEEKSRELTKNKNLDLSVYDQVDSLKDEIERLEKDNHDIEVNLSVISQRLDDLNSQLAGYKPVRDLQLRREELDKRLKKLEKEKDDIFTRKKEFIRTYYTLFHLYPRLKSTLNMIDYKEKHGELPPRIDKRQVEELLENHDANCPMCDGELNDHAIDHLKQLLLELEVSSQSSNYLSSIKGGLENAIGRCNNYQNECQSLLNDEKNNSDEMDDVKQKLDVISKYLMTYSDDHTDIIDISKIEKERNELEYERSSKEQRKGANEVCIKQDREKLVKLEKEIKELEKRDNENTLLRKQVTTLRSLTNAFMVVKKNLMDEIKIEIEKNTWESFKNMIWKKETFYSLEINDEYQMTVKNYNLNDMTGSLSATESMALAYSFTLAIHKTSGRNCPLVVDSPLGRVSDENRVNMAKELLKISKDKQIIMLFTPDEYSSEVADIYDDTVASIRDLSLVSNESEIGKVVL